MKKIYLSSVTVVWLLLFVATACSWWLGRLGQEAAAPPSLAGVGLILLSFIKVRFVMMYFMELRDAPLVWRAIYEGWIVVVCAASIFLYAGHDIYGAPIG
jgi:hypothetical protein